MPNTYTVKEVAEILGYSTNSIYTFLNEKRIKGVRVGRGRFRIPEAEINRLLSVGRKKEELGVSTSAPPAQSSTPLSPSLVESSVNTILNHHSLRVPSLFDWFVASTSVVVGLSLFLFSRGFDTANLTELPIWFWPLRLVMVGSGVGLLLVEFLGKSGRTWSRLFLGILGLCFTWLTVLLWQNRDMGGVFLYGLLATMIFFHLLFRPGELPSLVVYGGLLALVTPVMALFFPSNPWLPPAFPLYQSQPVLFSVIWVLGVALAFGVAVWGFRRKKLVFSALLGVIVCLELVVAFWLAKDMYWVRAFFMLVIVLTTVLVLEWRHERFTPGERRVTITLLAGLLALLVLAVGVIWIIQQGTLQVAEKQMEIKAAYGRLSLETVMHQVAESVEGLAQNPLLIEALDTPNPKLLAGLTRSAFEGNSFLYRVFVFDKNGDVVVYYPLANPLIVGNVGFRDYFTKAVNGRETAISDLFEAKTEARQPAIMVVTPVFGKDRQIIGATGGLLNIPLLGERLQQLAAGELGEQFVVVDRTGRRMIHPAADHVFTPIEEDNLLRRALAGERGVSYAFEAHGPQMLQAYEAIPSLGWGIMVEAPVATLMRTNQVAVLTIAVLTAVSGVVLAVFFAARRLSREAAL